MPLSEEELRLLEQMERALVAEDPKLASTLRGTKVRQHQRRAIALGVTVFVVGIVLLMSGAVTSTPWLGVVGFVVMLAAVFFTLTRWKSGGGAAAAGPQAALGRRPAGPPRPRRWQEVASPQAPGALAVSSPPPGR